MTNLKKAEDMFQEMSMDYYQGAGGAGEAVENSRSFYGTFQTVIINFRDCLFRRFVGDLPPKSGHMVKFH